MATRFSLNGISGIPAGQSSLKVKAKADGYTDSSFSNSVTVTKASTPTNPSSSGTTISFDEVANAIRYDIYVDGNLFDSYTPVSLPYLFDVNNNQIQDSNGEDILVNDSSSYTSNYTYQEIDAFITSVL